MREGGMHGGGMHAMGMRAGMCDSPALNLMAACFADLGDLGLPPEAQKALEGKRFELQKKAIRGMADLKILRLEASHLLEGRAFDLKAADDKMVEVSKKEAELHSAHLGFLHDLGASLTDAQWKELMDRPMDMMPMMGFGGGMMPMDGNCRTMSMMNKDGMGRMMSGDDGSMPMMMDGGDGMMRHGQGMDSDTGKEAEKFFKENR